MLEDIRQWPLSPGGMSTQAQELSTQALQLTKLGKNYHSIY